MSEPHDDEPREAPESAASEPEPQEAASSEPETRQEPPASEDAAQEYWNGLPLYRCPHCAFATIDSEAAVGVHVKHRHIQISASSVLGPDGQPVLVARASK